MGSLASRLRSRPHLLAGNTGHVKRDSFDIVKRDNAWLRAGPCGGNRPSGRGCSCVFGLARRQEMTWTCWCRFAPGMRITGRLDLTDRTAPVERSGGLPTGFSTSDQTLRASPTETRREARGGVNHQGREKRRRWTEAGVESRGEGWVPAGNSSRDPLRMVAGKVTAMGCQRSDLGLSLIGSRLISEFSSAPAGSPHEPGLGLRPHSCGRGTGSRRTRVLWREWGSRRETTMPMQVMPAAKEP